MLRLLKRTAFALAIVVVGLVLVGIGVEAGAWVALAGIVLAFLVNLIAPFPPWLGWRE